MNIRPHMSWKGSDDRLEGEAEFTVGDFKDTICLYSCSDAMRIDLIIDEAYDLGIQHERERLKQTLKNFGY